MNDWTKETTADLVTRIKVVKKGALNCEKQGMKSTAKGMRVAVAEMEAELIRRKK